jgi:hypothetical protein
MRNCPGDPERAGKPPTSAAQTPGVVTRKRRVVRNLPTARAGRVGEQGEERATGMPTNESPMRILIDP